MIQDIPYSFRRSARARRVRILIDATGSVSVVAPLRSPLSHIDYFVQKQQLWIKKHVEKARKKHRPIPPHYYDTGDSFLFFGAPHRLEILECDRKKPAVAWRDSTLYVSIPCGMDAPGRRAMIQKALHAFFKEKAEEVIHDRLEHFNSFYHFEYRRVTLREQKSRWGSCSRLKNLNFNWRLIQAPIQAIDYVVVHELCHLKEMNHSARFWALVSQTLPDHKQWRRWIKDHQGWLKA